MELGMYGKKYNLGKQGRGKKYDFLRKFNMYLNVGNYETSSTLIKTKSYTWGKKYIFSPNMYGTMYGKKFNLGKQGRGKKYDFLRKYNMYLKVGNYKTGSTLIKTKSYT